jgi:hypothetical protein
LHQALDGRLGCRVDLRPWVAGNLFADDVEPALCGSPSALPRENCGALLEGHAVPSLGRLGGLLRGCGHIRRCALRSPLYFLQQLDSALVARPVVVDRLPELAVAHVGDLLGEHILDAGRGGCRRLLLDGGLRGRLDRGRGRFCLLLRRSALDLGHGRLAPAVTASLLQNAELLVGAPGNVDCRRGLDGLGGGRLGYRLNLGELALVLE